MLVEPSAASGAMSLSDLDVRRPRETTMLVGPEGGWEPSELEQAAATCRMVTLGSRTLRADAVPVVAMAALFAMWKEF
jgi:RsmE family RNA methyltransferase